MDGCTSPAWDLASAAAFHQTILADDAVYQVNAYRTSRVADVLSDFRTLQYYITAVPADPPNSEDYYTEGWAALRQCALDGQHILQCAADTSVPSGRSEEEQRKAELKQYLFPLSQHARGASLD